MSILTLPPEVVSFNILPFVDLSSLTLSVMRCSNDLREFAIEHLRSSGRLSIGTDDWIDWFDRFCPGDEFLHSCVSLGLLKYDWRAEFGWDQSVCVAVMDSLPFSDVMPLTLEDIVVTFGDVFKVLEKMELCLALSAGRRWWNLVVNKCIEFPGRQNRWTNVRAFVESRSLQAFLTEDESELRRFLLAATRKQLHATIVHAVRAKQRDLVEFLMKSFWRINPHRRSVTNHEYAVGIYGKKETSHVMRSALQLASAAEDVAMLTLFLEYHEYIQEANVWPRALIEMYKIFCTKGDMATIQKMDRIFPSVSNHPMRSILSILDLIERDPPEGSSLFKRICVLEYLLGNHLYPSFDASINRNIILLMSSRIGLASLVQILVRNRVEIFASDYGCPSLSAAVEGSHWDVVELLLSDVDVQALFREELRESFEDDEVRRMDAILDSLQQLE